MTRTPYQEQLHGLEQEVLDQLQVVSGQLRLALAALEHSDGDAATAVVEGDQEVDRRYGRLQSELVTVIARQAPVASDLRLITALLHITRMVERIGDQCVNVAKLVTVGGPPPAGAEEFQRCLVAMGGAAQAAVHEATRALQEHDAAAARDLADSDSEINELNRSCFTRAIALGDSEDRRTWATAMILVARALERIADNAVDITAHIGFAITGTFESRPDTVASA